MSAPIDYATNLFSRIIKIHLNFFNCQKHPALKCGRVFLSISKMPRIFDDRRKSLISEMLGNRMFTSGESPGIAHGDFRHFNPSTLRRQKIWLGEIWVAERARASSRIPHTKLRLVFVAINPRGVTMWIDSNASH